MVSSVSAIVELNDVDVTRSGGSGIDSGAGAVLVLAVVGRSSGTVDCLLDRRSSSASSAISINRRLRSELVEEEVEPDAVWSEHAADNVLSFNSLGVVIGKTVSFGENRSVTALKCTVARALEISMQAWRKESVLFFTLDQPRALFWYIFNNNIPPSISQEPKQWRYFIEICY